jgi:hypothetical protein
MGVDYGSKLWWHAFDGDELGKEVESIEMGGGLDGVYGEGTTGQLGF